MVYECEVIGRPVGITVWRGSALDSCPGQEIGLPHFRFMTANVTVMCNNNSISAKGLSVSNETEIGCYVSQLTVNVTSEMIGKSIECFHDDVTNTMVIGSLRVIQPGNT